MAHTTSVDVVTEGAGILLVSNERRVSLPPQLLVVVEGSHILMARAALRLLPADFGMSVVFGWSSCTGRYQEWGGHDKEEKNKRKEK
jgi:hypothetical protein